MMYSNFYLESLTTIHDYINSRLPVHWLNSLHASNPTKSYDARTLHFRWCTRVDTGHGTDTCQILQVKKSDMPLFGFDGRGYREKGFHLCFWGGFRVWRSKKIRGPGNGVLEKEEFPLSWKSAEENGETKMFTVCISSWVWGKEMRTGVCGC